MKSICSSILSIAPHIKQAIQSKRAVVALQSTIISHGMPYPQNKQCAFSIQNQVRKYGATPATIAIIDGKIKVGLTEQQIQRLAFQGTKVKKVSRRDLAYILMTQQLGATTVSSTMIGAEMAGIDIFVTGGIGGVHRGYENTLDASADLRELGQTPVTVVSAGVKSILDIPKTLEYLETEGVPVITYKSQQFPAFFSRSSGIKSPTSLNSTSQIAKLLFKKDQLNLRNGVLVAVPNNNPAEGQQIQKAIQSALKQAQQQKINGARITPFLLKRVNQLTKGKSLKSNISLVHNNAQIGSKIAVDLANLRQQARKILPKLSLGSFDNKSCQFRAQNKQNNCSQKSTIRNNSKNSDGKVIIIGANAIDCQYRPLSGQKFQLYKSCRGVTKKHMGGVGRNISQVVARLGVPTSFITPLGKDHYSHMIRKFCKDLNINLYDIISETQNTAEYLTILDEKNDEMVGISTMEINNQLSFDNVYNAFFRDQLRGVRDTSKDIVIVDANFNHDEQNLSDLKKLLQFLNQKGYFIIYECKGRKTKKIAHQQLLKQVSLIRMNQTEYDQLFKSLRYNGVMFDEASKDAYLSKIVGDRGSKKSSILELMDGAKSIITNKSQPIRLIFSDNKFQTKNVLKSGNIIKTTGAGDTLTGALAGFISRGKHVRQALDYALLASKLTIETSNKQSVISNQISFEQLQRMKGL